MLNDGAAWRRKTNRSSHPGLAAQAAGAAKPAKDPVKGGQSFCPPFFIPVGSPFFCYSALQFPRLGGPIPSRENTNCRIFQRKFVHGAGSIPQSQISSGFSIFAKALGAFLAGQRGG